MATVARPVSPAARAMRMANLAAVGDQQFMKGHQFFRWAQRSFMVGSSTMRSDSRAH